MIYISKELFDIIVSFIGNLDLHLDFFGEKNEKNLE